MSGTDVAERDGAELAPLSAEEQELVDAAKGQIDSDNLILPALKLTQSLTAEVQAGDAEQGHFINSLTGEDYGDEVEIVISSLFTGRFYTDRETNQSFVAQGDVAPSNWPDEYAGKAFTDLPDAEEQWKAAVNAEEHPWGNGPPISTTHNFVGLVVTEGDAPDLPVRLSLMRTGNKAAEKLKTLIWGSRAQWDRTYVLKAKREVSNDRPYFKTEVSRGTVPTPEYRQAAVALAQSYAKAEAKGGVDLHGDDADGGGAKKAPPKNTDGLKV